MRAVHYAGNDFITGTAIAAAVLEYARGLAETDGAATVDIPVIGQGGKVVTTTFLLGPSSQLTAEDLPDYEGEELEDSAVVAELTQLARARTAPAEMRPAEPFVDSHLLDELP